MPTPSGPRTYGIRFFLQGGYWVHVGVQDDDSFVRSGRLDGRRIPKPARHRLVCRDLRVLDRIRAASIGLTGVMSWSGTEGTRSCQVRANGGCSIRHQRVLDRLYDEMRAQMQLPYMPWTQDKALGLDDEVQDERDTEREWRALRNRFGSRYPQRL